MVDVDHGYQIGAYVQLLRPFLCQQLGLQAFFPFIGRKAVEGYGEVVIAVVLGGAFGPRALQPQYIDARVLLRQVDALLDDGASVHIWHSARFAEQETHKQFIAAKMPLLPLSFRHANCGNDISVTIRASSAGSLKRYAAARGFFANVPCCRILFASLYSTPHIRCGMGY